MTRSMGLAHTEKVSFFLKVALSGATIPPYGTSDAVAFTAGASTEGCDTASASPGSTGIVRNWWMASRIGASRKYLTCEHDSVGCRAPKASADAVGTTRSCGAL